MQNSISRSGEFCTVLGALRFGTGNRENRRGFPLCGSLQYARPLVRGSLRASCSVPVGGRPPGWVAASIGGPEGHGPLGRGPSLFCTLGAQYPAVDSGHRNGGARPFFVSTGGRALVSGSTYRAVTGPPSAFTCQIIPQWHALVPSPSVAPVGWENAEGYRGFCWLPDLFAICSGGVGYKVVAGLFGFTLTAAPVVLLPGLSQGVSGPDPPAVDLWPGLVLCWFQVPGRDDGSAARVRDVVRTWCLGPRLGHVSGRLFPVPFSGIPYAFQHRSCNGSGP